jgi:hypothetical protein
MTYVWCFYICIIPFCFLASESLSFYVSNRLNPKYPIFFNVLNSHDVAGVVYGFCLFSTVLSWYLIPLILAQRFTTTCYRAMMNKLVRKSEDNAQYWQHADISSPISVFRFCAKPPGKLLYWIAVIIMFGTLCDMMLHASPYCMYVAPLKTVIALPYDETLFRFAIGYLIFSITLQSLFSAFWKPISQRNLTIWGEEIGR